MSKIYESNDPHLVLKHEHGDLIFMPVPGDPNGRVRGEFHTDHPFFTTRTCCTPAELEAFIESTPDFINAQPEPAYLFEKYDETLPMLIANQPERAAELTALFDSYWGFGRGIWLKSDREAAYAAFVQAVGDERHRAAHNR